MHTSDSFPPPPVPGELYLHLFHGRKSADEPMDDWGQDGPHIGPLRYVHTTYATDVKFAFRADGEAAENALATAFGLDATFPHLKIVNGCLEYGGMFYGDWSIYVDRDA